MERTVQVFATLEEADQADAARHSANVAHRDVTGQALKRVYRVVELESTRIHWRLESARSATAENARRVLEFPLGLLAGRR